MGHCNLYVVAPQYKHFMYFSCVAVYCLTSCCV